MNTKRFSYIVAAVVLAACSRMENPVESNVPVALLYSTVAAAETKAAQNLNEGNFASGETVKVRISNTGENTWTDYNFTTSAAGAMSPAGTVPYYPAGAQNIDIVAYYPATAGTDFTVATDQTGDDDYKASDLMFASVTNQAKQAAAVELAFTHKMAKLCVNITAGTGVTSITSVSILNVKPTVSFNQATGAVGEASGAATAIAVSNNGAAVIPAQTIDGGLLSIVTDKGTATYSVTNKSFEAGKVYTMNITVNLRSVGTTTAITGWTGEGTVTVNPVQGTTRGPAGAVAVDMGHPDGVKWANMNVGATTETGYGDYFAWGVTIPYYVEYVYGVGTTGQWIGGKTGYDWENYPFMQSHHSYWPYITKYTFADGKTDGIWYDGNTFKGDKGDGVEHKDFASYDYEDDAARANWGGTWRTPTEAEWTWLSENCTWTCTTQGGVMGMLVRSNIAGYTDNTIFLPAAGIRTGGACAQAGVEGYYWSSSLSLSYAACYMRFFEDFYLMSANNRSDGYSVRPVTD